MLVSRNTVRFETKDHKPTDPHERQRITRHGGYIQMNRVNGNLALSRYAIIILLSLTNSRWNKR